MKNCWMKVCAFLAAVTMVGAAQAGIVDIGSYSTIGDAGVAGDGRVGRGRVDYDFQISNHEVTYGQWTAMIDDISRKGIQSFQNTGGTAENHWVDTVESDDAPVVHISLVEATYYANWLTSGNPYQGAYSIDSAGYPINDRAGAIATYGYGNVYVLPTENEWYKAAYYRSSAYNQDGEFYAAGTWADYSDGSNDSSGTDQNQYPITQVNTNLPASQWTTGWAYNAEGVRSALYGEEEQNGTYNMMGNVYEWMEMGDLDETGTLRGGTGMKAYSYMRSISSDDNLYPWESDYDVGFRMARLIPEPMTIGLAMIGGCVAWFARLKQRL